MIDITKTTYLTAEEICARLSVSRSTFDRWRKIPAPPSVGPGIYIPRSQATAEEAALGLTPFPEPALYVGGSPRWDARQVNAWLAENANKRNRRGISLGGES